MQKHPEVESESDDQKSSKQRVHDIISEQVMRQLGRPSGAVRVLVRKLWRDRYRVNVVTGPEAGNSVIAHSFFLVTDGEGVIVAADPRITKKY